MRLEALKYLYEMQQACRLMATFLVGKAFADWCPFTGTAMAKSWTVH
jgi:hypothetical protein